MFIRGKILLGLLLFVFTAGYAQTYTAEGTEFYLSFLSDRQAQNNDFDVVISHHNSNPVVITIKNPAKPGTYTVHLASTDTTATVSLSKALWYLNGVPDSAEKADYFGWHITANDTVSISVSNGFFAISDGTQVLPVHLLGSEYFVAAYKGGYSQISASSCIIVATADSTRVRITPATTTSTGRPAGIPFTVLLNKGQTYMVQAVTGGSNDTFDLTGTRIVAEKNKKIAVFSGNVCTTVPACGACDMLYEQLLPVNVWGKKFFMVPPSTSTVIPAYTYRIIASCNKTGILINGMISDTIDAGEYYTRNGQNGALYIEANKPVSVVQYTEGISCAHIGDPSMVIIPPVEQFIKKTYFSTCDYSGFTEHYAYVIIPEKDTASVLVDNIPLPASAFNTFAVIQGYRYANFSLARGPHTVQSPNGLILIAYGYGNALGYSFVGGCNFRNLSYDIGVDGNICGSLSFGFSTVGDVSQVVSSQWDFGDNTSANGIKVKKTYTQPGTYIVKNVVTIGGLVSYTTSAEYVLKTMQNPLAGFTINRINECEKQNYYVFTDTSIYNASGKNKSVWELIDTFAVVPDSLQVVKTFQTPGNHTVKLKIWSSEGCMDSSMQTIVVKPSAQAAYTVADTQCFNKNVFKPVQQSRIASPGNILGYKWLFGDNTADTATIPLKKFTDTGAYSVTLIALASNGCHDTARSSFMVLPSPVAGFSGANTCFGNAIKLLNNSAGPKGALKYSWSFDDGTNDTLGNTEKLFADTGRHSIKLVAKAENDCTDSVTKQVRIYPLPVPDFSYGTLCAKTAIVFKDNTNRHGETAKQNRWTINNGNPAINTGDLVHTFSGNGAVSIKLVAEDNNGCADSIAKTAYINSHPVAAFTINDSTQCAGSEYVFDSEAVVSPGMINKHQWLLDNKFFSAQPYNKLTLGQPGTYKVKLKVETDSFCTDSTEKNILVYPQPVLDISVNDTAQCEQGNSFEFTNKTAVQGSAVFYTWIFSTRDTLYGKNIAPKSFIQPGRYRVQVFANTADGCVDKTEIFLKVSFNPLLNFKIKPVCQNDSAFFDNLSAYAGGSGAKWLWNFGDGNTSAEKSPLHQYGAAGNYPVTLIGVSSEGCGDTLTIPGAAAILPAPKALFSIGQYNHFEDKIRVEFINKTTNADYYNWSFGNGASATDKDPVTIYADTGRFRVNLSASNTFNCYDRYDTTIYLQPFYEIYIPNAFSPNKDPLNRTFRVEGTYYYRQFEMTIFDRWGQLMFRSVSPSHGWDGTFNNDIAAEGIYVYTIRMMDVNNTIHILRGTVTLLR